MEPNFEHIKRSFAESPPSLPPELDWEQMEEGILQKMDALEAEESSRKPFFIWLKGRRIGLVIILVLLGVVAMLALYPESPFQSQLSVEEQASSETGSELIEEPQAMDREGAAFVPVEVEAESSRDIPSPNPAEERHDRQTLNQASTGEEGVPSACNLISAAAKAIPTEDSELEVPGSSEGLNSPFSNVMEEDSITEVLDRSSAYESMEFDLSPIRPSSLTQGSILSSQVAVPSDKPFPVAHRRGRLMATVGSNIWSPSLGGPRPERFAYETPLVSFQTQLSYLQPIKQQWLLSIGVQYQRLESRFSRTFEIEDFEVTLTDVVLRRENNLFTGKVQEQRGDITLKVPAKRIITHFNSMELYQVQFAIGHTWTASRLRADLLVGGSVNLLTCNRGRSLYEGEPRFYDGAETNFLANQARWAALVQGRLTYQLDPHWGIVSGLQWQQVLQDWSLEPGTRMYPTVMGLDLGLSYQW